MHAQPGTPQQYTAPSFEPDETVEAIAAEQQHQHTEAYLQSQHDIVLDANRAIESLRTANEFNERAIAAATERRDAAVAAIDRIEAGRAKPMPADPHLQQTIQSAGRIAKAGGVIA